MTIITIMVSVEEVNGLPQKLFSFRSVAMSDQKKNRADAISADAFVAAYVETYHAGGTVADLASKLNRSVEQTRAKRNSVAKVMKERGFDMSKIKLTPQKGSGSESYDRAESLLANLPEFGSSDSE